MSALAMTGPDVCVGTRVGARVVIAEASRYARGRRVRVMCDCGRTDTVCVSKLLRTVRCGPCSRSYVGRMRARNDPAKREPASPMAEALRESFERSPAVWNDGYYRELSADDVAHNATVRREMVAEMAALLGPLTLEEVREVVADRQGRPITREGVRQIQAKAERTMKLRCRVAGIRPPAERGPTMADLTEVYAWGDE